MLNANITKLLNEQSNKEMFSAHLFLDISNFYISKGMNGFANWFHIQAQEEIDHACIIINYLQNRSVFVELGLVMKPLSIYKDLEEPLKIALKQEEVITNSLNIIYAEIVKEHDLITQDFLDWFIKEHKIEEKNIRDLITTIKLHDSTRLNELDGQLAQRIYKSPSIKID